MATLLVVAVGVGVSVYEGIVQLIEGQPLVAPLLAYGVLAIDFGLKRDSTLAAFRESRRYAGRSPEPLQIGVDGGFAGVPQQQLFTINDDSARARPTRRLRCLARLGSS